MTGGPASIPAVGPGVAQFLALLPDPCVLVDPQGRVLAANPAWQRRLGRDPAGLVGQALAGAVHPDDRAALGAALAALARGADPGPFVARCRNGAGGWRAMDWAGQGAPSERMACLTLRPAAAAHAHDRPRGAGRSAAGPCGDDPCGGCRQPGGQKDGSQRDGGQRDGHDTGRHDTGRGARIGHGGPGDERGGPPPDGRTPEHARLRCLFEISPIPIALTDLETGRFLDVNPAYTAMTGYTLAEMQRTDLPALAEAGGWRAALEAGMAALRRDGRYGPDEMTGRRRDGSPCRARVRATTMRDGDGRLRVWSFVEDVSAEHAHRTEGALLAHVLRSTNALVTLTDAAGRITWVNDAFERETGWRLAEVQGRTPGSVLQGPRTDPHTVARLGAAVRAGQPVRAEILNRCRDGREIWLDLDIQPRHGPDGALLGFMAIQIDITARKRLEHDLRAEHNRLRATLQAMPDMVIELDADGRYERILCRDTAMLAHPPEAHAGRLVEEMLPPDLAAMIRRAFAEVDAGGEVRGRRFARMVEGRQLWLESSITRRAPAAEGARPGYLILTRDITARAAAEEEHARLGEIVALTTNLVILLDTACRVEWANPAFEAHTGWRLAEIRGRPLAPLVRHPDSDPATIARLEAALHAQRPFRGEILNRTRDGRPYWVDFDVHPRRGPDGALIGHVSVETVISARKALEAELACERDYLGGLMDTLICGIVALDAAGRIVLANGEAETILGLDRSALPGRRYDDPAWRIEAVEGGPMPPGALPFARVMATGRSLRDVRHAIVWPDGTRRVLSINAAPVRRPGDGAPPGARPGARVICAITDVTGQIEAEAALREAAEAARAASRAKSRFLANMSHEIRTPLNGVLGMVELLAERLPGGEERAMLQTVRESGETLLAVLNDILDMSRIEAGKLLLEAEPLRPDDLAARIDRMYGPILRARGLVWRLSVAPEACRPVQGDAHRLLQILHNLVGNALKFTEAGGIGLTLGRDAQGALAIAVEDTGIGMEEAALARVRAEFEQADGSVTRRYGGTGLGLAIVSRLVELMGGTLEVDSRPGAGTTVRLSLPLPESPPETEGGADGGADGGTGGDGAADGGAGIPAEAAADFGAGARSDARGDAGSDAGAAADGGRAPATGAGPAPGDGAGAPPLAGLSLLVADDNATNRHILQAYLERDGARVVAVGDGRAALEAWRRGCFDAVLLDISMPVMDGEMTLAAMQAEAAMRGRTLPPVLAVTAHALAEQAAQYRAAGFADHLAKPLRRAALRAALLSALAPAGR